MTDVPNSKPAVLEGRKIFVLGDSRTGTMALANYFKRQGLESVHYYIKEAQQIEPLHLHQELNLPRFREFIRQSNAVAFSDYPTRNYYRFLHEECPNDFFILTIRRDTATWANSMSSFFGKFDFELDMDTLVRAYEGVNDEIRSLYGSSRRFLEICIDDDSVVNSKKISNFLGLNSEVLLAHENRTSAMQPDTLSGRWDFYGSPFADVLVHIKQACMNSKVLPSASGWLYLVNDSNEFLDYLYGQAAWTSEMAADAIGVIDSRVKKLIANGVSYEKFIVPEKAVIYPEFLPEILKQGKFSSVRPAIQLSEHPNVSYLANYLLDAKSYGPLYFKTDTHPTWLGAYLIYRRIVETLERKGLVHPGSAIPIKKMIARIAAYEGDLLAQIRTDHRSVFEEVWGTYLPENLVDHKIQYTLPDDARRARRVKVPAEYEGISETRETFVFEQDDTNLPKAVIFRDSTSDFCVELLAEHFSRSVFVWKDGQVFAQVVDLEDPDVVIHIMAERFVSHYPKHVALIAGRPFAS